MLYKSTGILKVLSHDKVGVLLKIIENHNS